MPTAGAPQAMSISPAFVPAENVTLVGGDSVCAVASSEPTGLIADAVCARSWNVYSTPADRPVIVSAVSSSYTESPSESMRAHDPVPVLG